MSAPLTEVTAAEAITQTANGTWLLDVREQNEWDLGHAVDAHLVPLSELGSRLSDIPTGERVLVVCHAGSRSLRATRALLDKGYDAVNVAGGMLAWSDAGGPLTADNGSAGRIA